MRLRRKVCVLGASGVGKTSLVRRFAEGKFDEDHQRTIGVAISKGTLTFDDISLELMLWDYEGAEPSSQYSRSFISGASGLVFVVDVTRPETLDHLLEAQVKGRGYTGSRPSVLVANKIDLTRDFALNKQQLDKAGEQDWLIVQASAKSGDNVDDAFAKLGQMMLDARKKSA
ncbi:MAG: GTP-binding protein [Myxococcales bacterium]|nr:GTP-binding protein [Myxococcales bacterium]MDH3843037.1 GTP-binding protein [Myxococcales bacterium]